MPLDYTQDGRPDKTTAALMGLDTVEFVIAVEQAFDVSIPDRDAQRIETAGELRHWLITEYQRLGRPRLQETAVFDRLRDMLGEMFGIDPWRVTPAARFVKDLGLD